MLLVGVAVLTFSSLVYFAEKDNPKVNTLFLDNIELAYIHFLQAATLIWDIICNILILQGSWSFLDSFWWGLMTLTTVGYGDLSPSTFPGKLIGNYMIE